ncbi:MAG: hypothetical protein KatS3mg044_0055 [Rhodothermaceae bacterium]|nr:MAG: DUF1232 domain-containing protein [Bacteroidota bacterium]GIV61189.1 MAG: hypothetical protein KatS3mg044_0055 [Rhodothermaceae bacterium]
MTVLPPSLPPRLRRGLTHALRAAARTLRRRARLARLLRMTVDKVRRHPEALRRVRSDVLVLARMARAWMRREYRDVPWRSLLYAVGALIYFVNPADLVPDALVGLGFVDDMAVIAAVTRALRDDLNRFVSWEEARTTSRPAPTTTLTQRP